MPMSKSEVKARLDALHGWKFDDDEIEKKFRFADFAEAMAFVNRVAEAAEAADHHPDIKISYSKVKLALSTHSEGGVTDKDLELAAAIDEFAPTELEEDEESSAAAMTIDETESGEPR
jgi:4a-hydroxytetrahydrobiopterin dehydratase